MVEAIGAALPGASWQRCRTHYARNLLSQVPKSAQPWVAALLRTVFEQPDTDAVHAQMTHVLDALQVKFPKAAEHLDTARPDLLAFTAFPREIWRQIWSNNPQERLNKEIWPRTDVVGIFPDRTALIRLVGAVLAEQNDEWTEARRYMGRELLARARLHPIDGETDDPAIATELTALPETGSPSGRRYTTPADVTLMKILGSDPAGERGARLVLWRWGNGSGNWSGRMCGRPAGV